MLLQALREFAGSDQSGQPRMYQSQPIRYMIDLDAGGTFLGIVDTSDPKDPAAKSGKRIDAPYIKRANAVAPQLLADTGEYLLGLPDTNKGQARADRTAIMHRAAIELVEECLQATGNPYVGAVATFMAGLDVTALALPYAFDPAGKATFRVDGVLPIELPVVQEFWGRRFDLAEGGDGPKLDCIACGELRPVLKRQPLKIKGIIGGQSTGTDLISANEDAYFSYGLENSLIAPVCVSCAEQYSTALNRLLADRDKHHLRAGNVEFLVWTRAPSVFNPLTLVSDPDEAQVRALVNSARSGKAGGAQNIAHDRFFAMALGANGSRVAVLSWIDTTTSEVQEHLIRYFDLQSLVDQYGAVGAPMALWRLGKATVRKGSKDQPDDVVTRSLLRLAFAGDPLPLDVMVQVLRRLRAEGGGVALDQPRAAMIKMVLGSQPGATPEERMQMTELNETNVTPAYLCGRLLAVLDSIQRQALGNPNATIIDRYYGAASTAPASVFGTLLHGSQNHLGKLRKSSRGAYAALEHRLEEVMTPMTEFPRTLTLQEQGMFALGFYHQRANDRAQRQERYRDRAGLLPDPVEAASEDEEQSGAGESNSQ